MSQAAGIPRHWWGKIIGGLLGLFRGGITGALLGALLGHMVDRFIAGLGGARKTRRLFFQTLFSTLGYIDKSDGRVSEAEIRAAESLMQRLQLTPEERKLAIRCFREGKEPDYPLEKRLREFARQTAMRHDLRHMLLEVLLEAASSDGTITPPEQAVLVRCCNALHISPEVFAAMWNAWQGGAARGSSGRRVAGRRSVPLAQAYAALGVQESASDTEVKRAYRRLIGQYHPDKLVSRGLPEEMMETARQRVREINTAYDRVKQARGFK